MSIVPLVFVRVRRQALAFVFGRGRIVGEVARARCPDGEIVGRSRAAA
jgi:hypothetical protein